MSVDKVTKLFRQEVKFIAGVAKINQFPSIFLPEIAFVGKSNVGKSSLINSICNNSSLARVSNTPGRTRQINFFSLADKLILVDLPGYGFAEVPIYIRQQWETLIACYLRTSLNLKLVNLLIDARRGIKQNDIEIAKLLLSCNKDFQIVFTKSDKVTHRENLTTLTQNFLATLGYSCNVIYTSSRSKEGAKELQFNLAKCIKL
ncbi:ribosome biogenesis GTP-binding protein YihA/YsxC [Candidatus Tisiphia endosymbiont of Ptychoptera albimana]|uniref:ribosome biogenesis GTP-binding protein YihA/YsxC n=1 Tax=Candidatus Tisiphia endosymbiont of Ptychoptera albimana TaxID=3066260 RepID=UPI00312C8B82